jgi:hypothetical protein
MCHEVNEAKSGYEAHETVSSGPHRTLPFSHCSAFQSMFVSIQASRALVCHLVSACILLFIGALNEPEIGGRHLVLPWAQYDHANRGVTISMKHDRFAGWYLRAVRYTVILFS